MGGVRRRRTSLGAGGRLRAPPKAGVEGAGEARTEVEVLGGLLGWERSDGRTAVRILWIRL